MLGVIKPSEGEPPEVSNDVPKPNVGTDDVLVEIKCASLCGSDLGSLTGDGPSHDEYPLILGHEGAGVVREIGENVSHVRHGDRVAIHYPTTCDRCKPCLEGMDNQCRNRKSVGTHVDGTFAEFISVPSRNALKMGSDTPFSWGSIASCAVSTGYHAISRSNVRPGDSVVVFGVGGVGLHAVLWADHVGAGTITAVDLVDGKLEMASEYGADNTLNPAKDDVTDRISDQTRGWGADVAIECSGSSNALEQAVQAVNGENKYESGTVVSVGLQREPLQAEYWELREGSLMVSGDHTRAELRRILDMLRDEAIDLSPSITHELPLEDIDQGIDLLQETDEAVGRIVLRP